MSEKKRRPQLTNQEFFQVCNAMQTHRDGLEREVNTKFALIVWIKSKTGLDVSEHAALNALGAVGIKLKWKRNQVGANQSRNKHNVRVLARYVAQLYRELKGEVPAELQTMLARLDRGPNSVKEGGEEVPEAAQAIPDTIDNAEPAKPVLGIPVKTVPKSQTIPVVNNHR